MKIVVQRVGESSVEVDGEIISSIGSGLLVLVGFHADDGSDYSKIRENFDYLIKKIMNLRIFPDDEDKMNFSLVDKNYEVLLVSQFTLYADCRKGNRPSFVKAMRPEIAEKFYNEFVYRFKEFYHRELVKDGKFGAMMKVSLLNDGPVTIIIEKP